MSTQLTDQERYENDRAFEAAVRRACESLWCSSLSDGGAVQIEGREVDGLFKQDSETYHLVEATTSSKYRKAQDDCKKLAKHRKTVQIQLENQLGAVVNVKCWFITKHDPSPEQCKAAKTHGPITACSLSAFVNRQIRASDYIRARSLHRFGSARHPLTNDVKDLGTFVPPSMRRVDGDKSLVTYEDLVKMISDGVHVVLLGDFGIGKSMTARQVFKDLAARYDRHSHPRFPVALNLRDHQHQDQEEEVLIRHAQKIAVEPLPLIRAWKSRSIDLILDGFDELAQSHWVGDPKRFRENRHYATTIVRELVGALGRENGVLITGRRNFFDRHDEMKTALKIDDSWVVLTMNEMSMEQVADLVSPGKALEELPPWLPTRPYLLAYLHCRQLLEEFVQSHASRGRAWSDLFQAVCRREAESQVVISVEVVERIAIYLAGRSRSIQHRGRFDLNDLEEAYKNAMGGAHPTQDAYTMLHRLAFFAPTEEDATSIRIFDEDFADVASAIEEKDFLFKPDVTHPACADRWAGTLRSNGLAILSEAIRDSGITSKALMHCIDVALRKESSHALAADLILAGMLAGCGLPPGHASIVISQINVSELACGKDGNKWAGVTFRDCQIGELSVVEDSPPQALPRFVQCIVSFVDGKSPDECTGFMEECEIEQYASRVDTSNQLMDIDAPDEHRVALTILRKLFKQSGSGRQESALFRGLSPREKGCVSNVLEALRREGMATRSSYSPVWHPTRAHTARALRILEAPHERTDPLFKRL